VPLLVAGKSYLDAVNTTPTLLFPFCHITQWYDQQTLRKSRRVPYG